jgi:hypothetical protein
MPPKKLPSMTDKKLEADYAARVERINSGFSKIGWGARATLLR